MDPIATVSGKCGAVQQDIGWHCLVVLGIFCHKNRRFRRIPSAVATFNFAPRNMSPSRSLFDGVQ